MISFGLLTAPAALTLAVLVGLFVHEWSHALALRLAGVDYTIEFVPHAAGSLGILTGCPWALVRPEPSGSEPPWVLRVAALMPLSLLLPVVVLAAVGAPIGGDNVTVTVAMVGWLACAIPSPQDFSVVWYAHRALDQSVARADVVGVAAD